MSIKKLKGRSADRPQDAIRTMNGCSQNFSQSLGEVAVSLCITLLSLRLVEGGCFRCHLISPLFKSAQTVSKISLPITGVNKLSRLAWGKCHCQACMCRDKGTERVEGAQTSGRRGGNS